MVLEKKPESSKDLASEKITNKVKSSTSMEPAATNIMTTDTDNSDVDGVYINKFGAKKTSRWNRPKNDVSLKDLEKVPTHRSKRICLTSLTHAKCGTHSTLC